MIRIRQGVFETNSSMVHVIGIPKDVKPQDLKIPKELEFKFQIFDSQPRCATDYQTKANYLYMGLIELLYPYTPVRMQWYPPTEDEKKEMLTKFISILKDFKAILLAHGVQKVSFEGLKLGTNINDTEFDYKKIVSEDYYSFSISTDIHETDYRILATVSELLLTYLFSPKARLACGRDESVENFSPFEFDCKEFNVIGNDCWCENTEENKI